MKVSSEPHTGFYSTFGIEPPPLSGYPFQTTGFPASRFSGKCLSVFTSRGRVRLPTLTFFEELCCGTPMQSKVASDQLGGISREIFSRERKRSTNTNSLADPENVGIGRGPRGANLKRSLPRWISLKWCAFLLPNLTQRQTQSCNERCPGFCCRPPVHIAGPSVLPTEPLAPCTLVVTSQRLNSADFLCHVGQAEPRNSAGYW